MCKTHTNSPFQSLGRPTHIWAIPAIHGDLEKLTAIHDAIFEHFKRGDRLLYHGNYTGYGNNSAACIDEILTFRRMILSIPGVIPSDITYLRGNQEEMWQKLLQLPFAPDPTNIFLWMLSNGLGPTLTSYGFCPHDGIEACRQGVLPLTKWTSAIREKIRRTPGHQSFTLSLKRAAHTDPGTPYPMLFVNAGIDTSKALQNQGDAFWWGADTFQTMNEAYAPFEKVIRGFDPAHKGADFNCIKATIDNGCGFGGTLMAAAFNADGAVETMLEA